MINGVGPMRLVKNRMNYALWEGRRSIKYADEFDNNRNAVIKGGENEEDGILAFATANHQVLVTNWNTGQQIPDNSDMSKMMMSCVDFAPFLFQHRIPDSIQQRSSMGAIRDVRKSSEAGPDDMMRCRYQPQIELLLGTGSGTVYCYDPQLKEKGIVVKYNNVVAVKKSRKVDHVRWFEAMQEGTNSNKFIVVFDDGTFYIFFRDLNYSENRYPQTVRIPTASNSNSTFIYDQINAPDFVPQPGTGQPEYKEYTREAIVKILQNTVEGFDFDQYYSAPYKQRN